MSHPPMRLHYNDLNPFDWSVSSIMTEGRDRYVISRNGFVYLVKLYPEGWSISEYVSEGHWPDPRRSPADGLDIWTACRILNDREARPMPS